MKLEKNEYYIVINDDGRVCTGVKDSCCSASRIFVRSFDISKDDKEVETIKGFTGKTTYYLRMFKRLSTANEYKNSLNEHRGSGWEVCIYNKETRELFEFDEEDKGE